jgi:Flp pilus assembly protein TadB
MRALIVLAVVLVLALPQALMAEEHVVSSADLHKQLVTAAKARQENLKKVQDLFASPAAKDSLKSAQIDAKRIETGVASLSDAELARLATQADKIQKDIAAGALSNQEVTYILIALATAVIILIIVAA